MSTSFNGCHIMQYPTGKWGFVGRVPRTLAWQRRDGARMTETDWHTVAYCMAPGSFGYGAVAFETEAQAIAALESVLQS
jgi:hypothetical protein